MKNGRLISHQDKQIVARNLSSVVNLSLQTIPTMESLDKSDEGWEVVVSISAAVKDTADSGSEITWKDGNEPFHVIMIMIVNHDFQDEDVTLITINLRWLGDMQSRKSSHLSCRSVPDRDMRRLPVDDDHISFTCQRLFHNTNYRK